jgi:hypothetical protein
MRNALSLTVLLTLTFAGVCPVNAAEPDADGSTSLADAIKAFNERAAENPIGKEQPPLTEEEVVAAIRWWDFERNKAPVSDDEYRAFRNVAETRRLPHGWEFEVLTGFEPNHQVTFDAWSVRIRMPRQNGMTYAFSIRERMIRSRLIGTEERKVIEKWDQSSIGSFERAEYRREREAAAALDRLKEK